MSENSTDMLYGEDIWIDPPLPLLRIRVFCSAKIVIDSNFSLGQRRRVRVRM